MKWTLAAIFIALVSPCELVFASPPIGEKIQVVATTSIIGDLTTNVGGDDIVLRTLVGPDGDPHEFQPVPADSLLLAGANVVFENGLGLENWLEKLYTSAGSSASRVVVSRGITVRVVPETQDDRDPHVWQNVENVIVMVENIRQGLIKADPAHEADYSSRAVAYTKELIALDRWVVDQINSIPPRRRKLVTSHDAFGYFGERYGIDVSRNSLESVTTEASDPSAREIVNTIEQIKSSGVPVIYLENIQNPKLMNRIASEAGVKIGPSLYSDALGRRGTDGDTYVKMIRHNVESLVEGLK